MKVNLDVEISDDPIYCGRCQYHDFNFQTSYCNLFNEDLHFNYKHKMNVFKCKKCLDIIKNQKED